jgi:hypothetical protein
VGIAMDRRVDEVQIVEPVDGRGILRMAGATTVAVGRLNRVKP